ncbi:SipW-dependent-type signal peptide-containing protein [Archaeoglobus veneficus]|uniref:Uncharacterized protein n=1 Tax=Archaeoglobus veneficus (strain DSM 11195 / SNP6) TaxID=693661 RepID=F2KN32_ARCVS|nr:SipW-dependent-type signal peptide-containing protein [Archaeoglobus veneficus]AEA47308.1 hypothetical protein Arcve_1302 [Archaeoglobus veneficus SNP6]
MQKLKIALIVVIAIALLKVYPTHSYFSDVETSTGVFKAGVWCKSEHFHADTSCAKFSNCFSSCYMHGISIKNSGDVPIDVRGIELRYAGGNVTKITIGNCTFWSGSSSSSIFSGLCTLMPGERKGLRITFDSNVSVTEIIFTFDDSSSKGFQISASSC